jgi:hypothetical protein
MYGLQFWVCVAIAFFVGGFFGSMMMAVAAMAKDSGFSSPTRDEHFDLDHGDDSEIAPG